MAPTLPRFGIGGYDTPAIRDSLVRNDSLGNGTEGWPASTMRRVCQKVGVLLRNWLVRSPAFS